MTDLYDYMQPEAGDTDYRQWTEAELLADQATGNENAADELQDRGIAPPSARATRYEAAIPCDCGSDQANWRGDKYGLRMYLCPACAAHYPELLAAESH